MATTRSPTAEIVLGPRLERSFGDFCQAIPSVDIQTLAVQPPAIGCAIAANPPFQDVTAMAW
jgi:hypothetical protein